MTADPEAAKRLREIREEAGFESAAEAARALGVKAPNYTHHENAHRGFAKHAAFYAARFGASTEWLLTGKGPKSGVQAVTLRGQVGAGEEVEPAHNEEEIARGDRVEFPRPRDSEAYVVRGDSMQPRFFRGEILIFEARPTLPTSKLIGQICRVEVDDGSSFVKILRRGSPGWNLHSMRMYEPPIENVKVRNVYRWLALLPPRRAEALLFAEPIPPESSDADFAPAGDRDRA